MCGILALIDTPWQAGGRSALAALASRGPDEEGITEEGGAFLGHRRLSVIDLALGHQPMATDDGRLSIVFNGEIYNFVDLRRELEAAGRRLRTHSDTEVILEGYRAWGKALVRRLDGMFAFAIWDRQARRLFAARDRLGVKPLFYSSVNGLVLASTLEPFFRLEGFPRGIDYQALRDYLAFQAVLAPASMLRSVRQLPPACTLTYDASSWQTGGQTVVDSYWEIPGPQAAAPSREECVRQVDEALENAVRSQLVSEVPLGAFLSGGIDSSLLVHYMRRAGAAPLKTFSVRFAAAGFDESPAAAAVARRYATDHQMIEAPAIGADELQAALCALDQPLADPAYVPAWELARLTRRHVTVALSGDGADELFGGYARFLDQESDHPDSAAKTALRALIRRGWAPAALTRRSLAGREWLVYRHVELGAYPGTRKDLGAYLQEDAWSACRPEDTLSRWRELVGRFSGRWDSRWNTRWNTEGLMRADLWTYLSENCLAKTDRASMAHGLEVRVPYLAEGITERILTWPARVHFDPSGKALLRELARRHLPPEVWDRPKHGFSVPLNDYFNGAWRGLIDDTMARCASLAPFLRPRALERLWQSARSGRASRRLAYTFFVLLVWLEGHRVEA